MSTETINFTCKKHCYKVFCAKPHTACLPDNRKVVCILKSELLPLKNLSCTSSLQQQHHPAPRVPEQGVRVRASQLSFSSPEPSLTTSSKLQVPNLLVPVLLLLSFRNTPQSLEFACPELRVLFRGIAFQEQDGGYSFVRRQAVNLP